MRMAYQWSLGKFGIIATLVPGFVRHYPFDCLYQMLTGFLQRDVGVTRLVYDLEGTL